VYITHIYRLHGLSKAIISNRDKIFASNIWKELFKLLKVDLQMSSAYHPQTDGQIERVNQCLKTYLRCFVHTCPTKWSNRLPLAEFWYNTCHHSALGNSPFRVLYEHEPNHFGIDARDTFHNEDLNAWPKDRELMQQVNTQHLQRAQTKMKLYADSKRSYRNPMWEIQFI
jgi:hypothetical protein